jgi:cytochrome c oxidase subunit 1
LVALVALGCALQARFLRAWSRAWGARLRLHLKILARDWLYTTNHKKLGLLYIIFAAVSGTLGTTLASLIRLELSQPGSFVFTNNGGAYHIVVAIHAILMVFFVVTPVVFGGFGNYFLPVQVGARDVAYPRLNNFSVWLLPAGLISTLRSLWDGARVTLQGALLEPQFSGQLWEPSYSERGTWAAYEASASAYRIRGHDATLEAAQFIGALGEARGLGTPEAADLGGLLPTYLRGPDMTMTMAG